ncbi:hypothetical protein N431DRAFT_535559 [Stipitochalara longipes BDJ]|nr:hypothetical protein N431DRAFT_535559 [Stipitochalara longipes BDJ]
MAPLTFGVELELCLATLPEGASDPEPYDARQLYNISNTDAVNNGIHALDISDPILRHHYKERMQNDIVLRHVAETLISAGFSAITDTDVRGRHNEALLGGSEPAHYKSWNITTDSSIRVPGEAGTPGIAEYEWRKLEVISPVLIFTPQAIRQVQKVCKLISRKYRTLTNEWCGLHVHVGQGSKGLPDYAIKNLAAMIWAFEDQLDLLHPLYRSNDAPCNSLYNSAPLAVELDFETDQPLLLVEQIDRILECETGDQVIELVNDECPSYGHAYNFWNLRSEHCQSSKRTIEFRQHEGTLEARRVENWIKVCTRLVEVALHTKPDCMRHFLRSVVEEEEYTVKDVLLSIGLSRQAKYYG